MPEVPMPVPPSPNRRRFLAAAAATTAGVAISATARPAAAGQHGWVRSTLARMTRDEIIGQLIISYVYGATADTSDDRNTELYGVATPAEVVQTYHLGGVIYFAWSDNLADPQQIGALSNDLQAASLTGGTKVRIPLQITTDQEMGVVTRVGPPATQFPGSMAVAATRNETSARTAARITGAELKAIGITTDHAPDADVNVNPLNPVIGVRSFSSDPTLAAALVSAQVKGYQDDGGIIATVKHFPGHGDTVDDSHTGLPVIHHSRAEWERIDRPPFAAAITAGVDMIMTAHIVVPSLDPAEDPATLSRPIMTGILRQQLGFDGVVITDSMAMEGVREKYGDAEATVRALEAGVDQLLMAPAPQVATRAINEALDSGRLTMAELRAKVARVLNLKYRNGLVANPTVDLGAIDRVVGTPDHLAAADDITDHTHTLLVNSDATLPIRPKETKILVTGYGVTTGKTLSAALTDLGATTTLLTTGSAPTDAAITAAADAATDHDVVVVTSYKIRDGDNSQIKLIAALQRTGVPVVVIAVAEPYDIAHLPDVTTYLATYSYNPVSMRSVVRVITGAVNPAGRLPVDIPAADGSGDLLFRLGDGGGF
ncbi:glycoside hydrolase family 3 protein [Microlunatus soli]|uniref:beta-N-acetylhexosaminidase n=1 Tax=Microlunatus soli TaxID=630515 RepID=A0A1H1W5I1_9ACTN|nr:glycoside hydrolase family 3 protein [Microlunatus soli]SDS92315.1 beta-N-acetylhexosaminidase [Microlunatus soli]